MRHLIIIIVTTLLMMGTIHSTAGRVPAMEFAPAFDWEGELDPNEFDNWKVVFAQPTPQGFLWMFIKNPDENSPIDIVVVMVDVEFTLLEYRYFKYGIPHSFIFDLAQQKYVKKHLTDEEKNKCQKCHGYKLLKKWSI